MAKRNKGGRPTKLTPELQAAIVARIQHFHAPPEAAAKACGISRSTLFEWVARGLGTHPERPAKSPFVEFADAIVKAGGESELWHWGKLHEFIAGKPLFQSGKAPANWGPVLSVQRHRALLWSLEHRFIRPPAPYDVPAENEGEVESGPPTITIVYGPDADDDEEPR